MYLSPRQQSFVHAYVESGNGSAAAIHAGYSERSAKVTASRLLTKANVRTAVRSQQAQIAKRLDLSREKVLAELQEAVRLARIKGDAQAMVAAWREVAKICGFHAPERKRANGSGTGNEVLRRLESLSDAELLALTENADKLVIGRLLSG